MLHAIKRVAPDTIEGLAIPFGRKDLVGESFDKDTDFCIEWFGPSGRPVIYDHGLDDAMKTSLQGRQTEYETRAEGIWAQAQLDTNRAYRRAVDELIEREALGFSSGAMPHLATKNARTGRIKRWPWVELSMTPMPADPGDDMTVHYTKSIRDSLALFEAADVEVPVAVRSVLLSLDDVRTDPNPETYADEYERLLLASKAFVGRAVDLADLRVKSGRVLSAANRDRLTELRQRIASASESASTVLRDLDELLTTTDPETAKGLSAAVFGALATEARMLGVDVPVVPTDQ